MLRVGCLETARSASLLFEGLRPCADPVGDMRVGLLEGSVSFRIEIL